MNICSITGVIYFIESYESECLWGCLQGQQHIFHGSKTGVEKHLGL
jgi:hypothetical protein